MSFLIDTSALVHLLRDRSGDLAARYDALVSRGEVALSRVTEFEVLRGAKDNREWAGLRRLLHEETLLAVDHQDWEEAARIVFDLRRRGVTLKSSIDCVIAQAALIRDLTVVHDDDDFERISKVRPLKLQRLKP